MLEDDGGKGWVKVSQEAVLGKAEDAAGNSGTGEVRGAGERPCACPGWAGAAPGWSSEAHTGCTWEHGRGRLDLKIRLGKQRAGVSWCQCRGAAALGTEHRRTAAVCWGYQKCQKCQNKKELLPVGDRTPPSHGAVFAGDSPCSP